MRYLFITLALLVCSPAFSGTWIYDKDIRQVEARGGTQVSVVLMDTDNVCDANRIFFEDGQSINQDAVNHYFSLMLMAKASNKQVSVHVEIDTTNNRCYGRIGIVK